MMVEDERMLAEILADTLSDRDFDVRLARDGAEALEICRRERFDAVVTDVMMPRMDGYTLVRTLRSEGCRAPVLFLTARSATEDVVRGFESGGNDFLRKPFAIDELIVRVRALVGRVAGAAARARRSRRRACCANCGATTASSICAASTSSCRVCGAGSRPTLRWR